MHRSVLQAMDQAIALLQPYVTDPRLTTKQQNQLQTCINAADNARKILRANDTVPVNQRDATATALRNQALQCRDVEKDFEWRDMYDAVDLMWDAADPVQAGSPNGFTCVLSDGA